MFQFPERHFLGDDVIGEMTFTWPRDAAYWGERQAMALRMQRVRCRVCGDVGGGVEVGGGGWVGGGGGDARASELGLH